MIYQGSLGSRGLRVMSSVERRDVMDSSRIEGVVRLERIGSENGDVMADVADMTATW